MVNMSRIVAPNVLNAFFDIFIVYSPFRLFPTPTAADNSIYLGELAVMPRKEQNAQI
jgi:hypothetical protein